MRTWSVWVIAGLFRLVTLPHFSSNQDESAAEFDWLWLVDSIKWAPVRHELEILSPTTTVAFAIINCLWRNKNYLQLNILSNAHGKKRRHTVSHLWDGIAEICRPLPAHGRNAAPAAKILTRYQPHWTFLAFIVCVQSPFISQFTCCIQHMPVWFQSGLPSACWETN